MTEHRDAKPKRVVQEKYVIFIKKESCVGMVKQSNIAQVHKKGNMFLNNMTVWLLDEYVLKI